MYRKKLIQKIQQLIDKLPVSKKKKEEKKDVLELKLRDSTNNFIMMTEKYGIL